MGASVTSWIFGGREQRRHGAATAATSMSLMAIIFKGLVASIPFALAWWEWSDRTLDKWAWDSGGLEFDFIVVGSGSSGAVVASRLSENPKWRILLLEAGGEPNPLQSIPALSFFLVNRKETDWQHLTVPQRWSCFSLIGQKSLMSQGRALGGTSNVNWLIHLRGHPKDFDHWAELTGDDSWKYKNLLPYFKRSEDYQGEWASDVTHGKGGPLTLRVSDFNVFGDGVNSAAGELGYKNVDLNGYYDEGFDKTLFPLQRGARSAVYLSYLRSARRRSNLVVRKYAHVNKVIIDTVTLSAVGVEYVRHGQRHVAKATKEVILSAGALQSPKILMLSGIGPADHLKSFGIQPLVDLRGVGQNLQDHLATFIPIVTDHHRSFLIDRDLSVKSSLNFFIHGSGPLTSSFVDAAGLITSPRAKALGEGLWPDLLYLFASIGYHGSYATDITRPFNVREDHAASLNGLTGQDGIAVIFSVARPKSKGYVKLASKDPMVPAEIDMRYYEDPEDLRRAIEGAKILEKLITNTTTFKSFGARIPNVQFEPCKHIEFLSDPFLECYLRHLSITLHHVVGTAAMGRIGDPNSVADSQLRVIGVRGLRVIDASIMPKVPVSNTQAPCVMIGEKGAELVSRSWA